MVEERIHTINLRKTYLKVPRYKRAQKAIRAIREYVKKHSKNDNVKIGKYLNLLMWSHGRKNPPVRVKVKFIYDKEKIKDKDVDFVKVELIDAPEEVKKEEPKKKGLLGKVGDLKSKKEEKPKEEKTEEDKKEEEKKEKKEVLTHKEVKLKHQKIKQAIPDKGAAKSLKQTKVIGTTGKK